MLDDFTLQNTMSQEPVYYINHCQILLMNSIKVNGCNYRGSNYFFAFLFSEGLLLNEEFAPLEAYSFL